MAKARKEGKLKTEFRQVDPKKVQLLKTNARYMKSETFKRLVQNIEADGCLTSVPLCYLSGRKLKCISGNHRTKAAIEAGVKEITVQVITTKITSDDFIAKQLSHNAITGEDNEDILRELWHKMQSVESKLYSGLDKETIEKLEMPTIPSIDIGLDYEQITLLFVGDEKEEVAKILKELKLRGIMAKENWVETVKGYDEVVEAIQVMCTRQKIHNYATAVVMMARCTKKYLGLVDAGEVTQVTHSASS